MIEKTARFPKFDSCFCYDLKTGSKMLGRAEIIIGGIAFALCLIFYSVYIKALDMVPGLVWLVLAVVNCE